jgi:uncharacterized membrane protein required for colicin V production
MNRDGLARKSAVVVAVFVVLLVTGWVVGGFVSGILSAIAIGTGVAVAIFYSGTRRDCSPRYLRRREQ